MKDLKHRRVLIEQATDYLRLSKIPGNGRQRQERALPMELLHRYSRLKVSVVYRVRDDLNDLNGLNCLNEQRSLPSGLEVRLSASVRFGHCSFALTIGNVALQDP